MATIESEISTGGESDGDALLYDGFISYSHAADDLLAPRLQSGLQRFAKPWWKRRALRIFRDESSLSANPHLWSSITESLDSSAWFVLLLSPDAAASPWVNQEIEYWKQHKDPSRILPVLTDGTFEWTDDDVSGTAVPEQLHSSFLEEPRWVDMRFARDEADLDLKDPRFADAVADIASALRGVPKDELASEEVKQHRRTVRTAWGAAALVGLLAVAATVFAFQSAENAARAEAEAKRAEENASDAIHNSRLARARELASSGLVAAEEDPQLGLLLALEAIATLPAGVEPGPDLETSLRNAMAADNLQATFELTPEPGGSQIALSPDGTVLLASADSGGAEVRQNVLTMLDAETMASLWTYSPDTDDFFSWVGFSSDGRHAYLSVWDQNSTFRDVEESDEEGDARIIVFDSATGDIVRTEVFQGACQVSALPGAWRADLGLFGFGFSSCENEFEGFVRIVDTDTWAVVFEWEAADNSHAVFADVAPTVAMFTGFNSDPTAAVFDVETWEPILEDLPYPWGDLSPDGAILAATGFQPFRGIHLVETDTGNLLDRFVVPQFPWRPVFSPGGDRLAIGSFADVVTVVDPISGQTLHEVDTGRMDGVDFNGPLIFTSWEGLVYRWDGSGATGGDLNTVPLGLWVNGNSIWWSADTVAAHVADLARNEWFIYPVDRESGALGDRLPGLAAWTPLTHGRIAYLPEREAPEGTEIGPLQVIDLGSGDSLEIGGCWMPLEAAEAHSICPNGLPHPSGALMRMGDKTGQTFGIIDSVPENEQPTETWVSIWDSETLEEVDRFSLGIVDACCNQLDRSKYTDEYLVLHNDWTGSILGVMDLSTRSYVDLAGDSPSAPVRRMEHDRSRNRVWLNTIAGEIWILDLDQLEMRLIAEVSGEIRAMAPSPSGDRIAVGTPDDNLWVFSETGELLHRIPLTNPSDGWWLDESHIVVGTANGPWTTISLDSEVLLETARSRVRRGFTEAECAFYELDPCPSMEEIRGG